MRLVPVDDPCDPRVAPFRDVRERDLVGREGLFVAEGEVVLRVLVEGARHEPLSVLIDARRLEKLAPLLERLPEAVPVHLAAQAVMDAVAGFHIHRGILALARRAPEPDATALLDGLSERALVLCLFGVSNHDNVGGAFRNAAAFGAQAVLLDPGCCDPLYRKAIRVSVGAALRLPFARLPQAAAAVELLAGRGFEPLALSPRGETPLHAVTPTARTAVLLGAEGPGLPDAVLDRCRTVRIPMAEGWDSLNVATTAGIVLHHLQIGSGGGGDGEGAWEHLCGDGAPASPIMKSA
ncbi:MAG TPA: RNA methyltransferase [Caulobacteraceae bacterium]|nr:RNA methyltransferase [Caulobacteraceae bacterium]